MAEKEKELFDLDLSSMISMLLIGVGVGLFLMLFSTTLGIIFIAGSLFFVGSFSIAGGFAREKADAKEYASKLRRAICLTLLFILTVNIYGILFGVPFQAVWEYLMMIFLQKVTPLQISAPNMIRVLNRGIPEDIPISQIRLALFVYGAMFGFGLMIGAGWKVDKWGERLTKWLYTTLFALGFFAGLLNLLSPIALQKILGWGPQINELIGDPLPSKLTPLYFWGGIAVIGAIIYGAKTKKWNALWGLFLLVALGVGISVGYKAFWNAYNNRGRDNEQVVLPTTSLADGWLSVPLPANMLVRSGIAATEETTEIRVTGSIRTKNGLILDADGMGGTKNSPFAILSEANLYQVIATLDPEAKEGWFPVGTKYRGEIPVGSVPNFRVNAKPALLSRFGRDEFSVQIK